MKKIINLLLVLLLIISTTAVFAAQSRLRILLIGDSTTEAGVPHSIKTDALKFEEYITALLKAEENMPVVETLNLGKSGETAKSIFTSGRYEKQIAPIIGEKVDYIFVRYGINDWFKCEDRERDFPVDLKTLLERLRSDFPDAKLVPMTIIPFMPKEHTDQMNRMIYSVSKDLNLEVFDIYTPYQEYLDKYGEHTLNVRGMHLDSIPKKYHEMLKSKTSIYRQKGTSYQRVKEDDNRLDYLLGCYSEWYSDRHPNLAGYYLIGKCTVDYILNDINCEK
ncbi:MAG: SGNH/GDSL hydrolase family protein [Rikenellaceae bacterium]